MGPESYIGPKGERPAQGKKRECSFESGKSSSKSFKDGFRIPNQHPISRHEGLILKELLSLKKRELTLCRELHRSLYNVSGTNHHSASLASKPNSRVQIPTTEQSGSNQKNALQAAMPHKLSKTAIKRLFSDASTYFSPFSAERTHFIPAGLLKPGQNPRNNQNVTTQAVGKTGGRGPQTPESAGRVQLPSTAWNYPSQHNHSLTFDDRPSSHCMTQVGLPTSPSDFVAGRSAKSSNCREKPPEHRRLEMSFQSKTGAIGLEQSLHHHMNSNGAYRSATSGVRASSAINLHSKLLSPDPITPASVKVHPKTLAVSANVAQKHSLPSFLTKKKRAPGGPRVKIDLGLERSCIEVSASTYTLFSRKSPPKSGGCNSSTTGHADLEGLQSKYWKKASDPETASIWGQVKTEQSHEVLPDVQISHCAQTALPHRFQANFADMAIASPQSTLPERRSQLDTAYLQPVTEWESVRSRDRQSGSRRKLSEVRSRGVPCVTGTTGVRVSGAN